MSFRSSELAIQPKIKSRLRMALRIYPAETTVIVRGEFGSPDTELGMSVEQLAEKILNEAIARDYPLVIECEKEIAKIERNMIELGKKK